MIHATETDMDRCRIIACFAARAVTPLMVALFLLHSSAAIARPGGNGTIAFEFATMAAEPVGRSLAGAHLASVVGPASLAWNPAKE